MRVVTVSATSGADGRLHLDIPTGAAGATFDVAVLLQETKSSASYGNQAASTGSLGSLYGCVTDDSFIAPERGMPRPVSISDSV
jgi:hypothetical protein